MDDIQVQDYSSIYIKCKTYLVILNCIIILVNLFIFKLLNYELPIIQRLNSKNYYPTWSIVPTKIENSDIESFSNSYLFQQIPLSFTGEKIRLKFSNLFGEQKLVIKSASIYQNFSNKTKTKNSIFFNKGNTNVIISSGKEVYSDELAFNSNGLSNITLVIGFGEKVPKILTGSKKYYFSYQQNYSDNFLIVNGEPVKVNDNVDENSKVVNGNVKSTSDFYYILTSVEIYSKEINREIIACFGDSLTAGKGIKKIESKNKNNSEIQKGWPELLSDQIHKKNINISVINKGLSDSLFVEEGINRFSKDVLDINGVKYIIINYGIYDITSGKNKAEDIINGYKKIIKLAKNKKIRIFGTTLLPSTLCDEAKEKERKKVNDWIKESKEKDEGFDRIFDFEAVIKKNAKDSKDSKVKEIKIEQVDKIYKSDEDNCLNFKGYKKLAESINLESFI